ncbi:hypothetical protein [Micromonospora sp. 067-2]|uniref:hypothetical protein n=1 Tax=Micromonospora sp. 067-2 TaxID=2789270 RepID=UPI00397B62DC
MLREREAARVQRMVRTLTGAVRSTGQIRETDLPAGFPRSRSGNLEQNLRLVEQVTTIASAGAEPGAGGAGRRRRSPADVAIEG